ncbi:MAG TPA: YggS family pyridoxal phosphate-dependent enzyme [bacterium]|nr:YggS family pyridoxal phosphate-dependent enzyme [bacterium]
MISKNLLEVRNRIAAAVRRAGRKASDITLVAVSKGQPVEKILEAIAAGQRDFGENYAQELLDHLPVGDVRWHFIGHLQRNKVKQIIGRTALIHTVDSPELALEIDKRAAAMGKIQPVLIELNLHGEASKTGLAPDRAEMLVSEMNRLPHVELRGLMTIPPATEDAEEARPSFRLLREIRDALNRKNVYKRPLADLSMGMTQDFEVAIEEGATFVRVGTGIFGERQKI